MLQVSLASGAAARQRDLKWLEATIDAIATVRDREYRMLPDGVFRQHELIQLRSPLLKDESGAEMAIHSPKHSKRRSARWLLLLLVIVPLLPEIFIGAIAGLAILAGCTARQFPPACKLQSFAVNEVIGWGLSAAGILSSPWSIYFYLGLAAWLVFCLVVLNRGWERVVSRLMIGAAITSLFALLPLFGPWFAIDLVADNSCNPQKASCVVFGGVVKNTYAALEKWYFNIPDVEVLLTAAMVGIFVVFAIFVVIRGVISARRSVETGRDVSA